ncbi:MAG: hypothetical protein ACKOQ3_15120 [Novosphingobium sp.]
MWELLDLTLFVRNLRRDLATPATRRRALKDMLWVLGIMTFVALMIIMVVMIRMRG